MNRVASRQRIFSWDAFDATEIDSVEEYGYESDEFDFLSCFSQSRHTLMGRSSSMLSMITTSERDDNESVVNDKPPSLTEEPQHSSFPSRKKRDLSGQIVSKSVSFIDLVQMQREHMSSLDHLCPKSILELNFDVQLLSLTYLGLDELKALASTCKFFHQMLTMNSNHGEVRNTVWWNLVTKSFPHVNVSTTLSPAKTAFASHKASLASSSIPKCSSVLNLCSLLTNAAPMAPSDIHTKYFSEQNNHLHSYMISHGESNTPIHVIQFKGQVGIGDRSIRTNQPLPRPHVQMNGSVPLPRIIERNIIHSNFFNRLRRNNRSNSFSSTISRQGSNIFSDKNKTLQPFVSPFVSRIRSEGVVEMDFTPRLMAYFEVSIFPRDKNQEPLDDGTIERHSPVSRHRERVMTAKACVAVGVSIPGFTDSTRMPGWDIFSYGYHGDDGGIFHSKGDMVRVFGPTYNVGDTVGCGVNYENGGIFYTLNGEWLGYAFLNERCILDGSIDIFPTIGIDSNHPLACNFGNDRPFLFNFSGLVANDGSMPIPTLE
jgi:hypothetical protein